VYQVPHFVNPGETLPAKTFERHAGGKGANQSVAIARAGGSVSHAGKIGIDGKWLLEKLTQDGVDTHFTTTSASKTGHAIIQVNDKGENAIIIWPGTNDEITLSEILATLTHFHDGDILLLQNEINNIPQIIMEGSKKKLFIAFNPAPMTDAVHTYPLHLCNLLILNETEASALANREEVSDCLEALSNKLPNTSILITAGARGAYAMHKGEIIRQPAYEVAVVDTTAAGDTFIGYFIAAFLEGQPFAKCMQQGAVAASLAIGKRGAMDSIPYAAELKQ